MHYLIAVFSEALGYAMMSLVVPVLLLIVYKASPRLRSRNPRPWYIWAAIAAALPIVAGFTSIPVVSAIATLLVAAFLIFGYVGDRREHRKRASAD